MHKDSILRYNIEKGFGETSWITCPSCWNSMKVTHWEDGTVDEECKVCSRMEREMERARSASIHKKDRS
jgi:Zn ribbon nucleic-acid-binding protein